MQRQLHHRASRLLMWLSLPIIATACVDPEAPSQYLDYETQADLRYPLPGESFVVWGGRKLHQNKHAASIDQRFAIDIVVLAPGAEPPQNFGLLDLVVNGITGTHQGDPKQNESYFCFGRPIIAPADGVVIDSIDTFTDNIPGEAGDGIGASNVAGNYVVIDHGNSEFSMFAHLKQGSVTVAMDDVVNKGDIIGECGNSGRSSEPHVHYHMQTTPIWLDGEGLPAQFNHYTANGEFIERGEPVQGQLIVSD